MPTLSAVILAGANLSDADLQYAELKADLVPVGP